MHRDDVHLIGTSYRIASVVAREAHEKRLRVALPRLRAAAREVAVLSTCNRFEVYVAGLPGERQGLSELEGDGVYRKHGVAAAEHVIRVACGIESAVLGDVQILAQIKQSRADGSGAELDRLFLTAIRAGRKARTETAIAFGRASIGSAIAGSLKARPELRRILVLGAGDAAKTVGAHLGHRRSELVWMNRTERKAFDMAERFGGSARPWPELSRALGACDVVVAATSAPRPVLTKELLANASARLVIDAGVPRNAEPYPRLEIITIDSIREKREHALSRRRAAIPAVERIVEGAVGAWVAERDARAREDVIRDLYLRTTRSAHAAAAAVVSSVSSGTSDHDTVERIIHRAMRALLHEPVRALRSLSTPPVNN